MKIQDLKVEELNGTELKSIHGGSDPISWLIAGALFVISMGYRDGRQDRQE